MRGFVCLQQRLVSCPDRHFTKKIQKIYSTLIKSIYSIKLVFQRIHKEKRVYVSILKASFSYTSFKYRSQYRYEKNSIKINLI